MNNWLPKEMMGSPNTTQLIQYCEPLKGPFEPNSLYCNPEWMDAPYGMLFFISKSGNKSNYALMCKAPIYVGFLKSNEDGYLVDSERRFSFINGGYVEIPRIKAWESTLEINSPTPPAQH